MNAGNSKFQLWPEFSVPGAPYFGKMKDTLQESDIELGECIKQENSLRVVNRRDELRRLPTTYGNAKAIRPEHMSTLPVKNRPVRDQHPRGRSLQFLTICKPNVILIKQTLIWSLLTRISLRQDDTIPVASTTPCTTYIRLVASTMS